MMDFDRQLEKFQKPDISEAVDILKTFVKEKMSVVADDIVIKRLDPEEVEEHKKERERLEELDRQDFLLRKFRKCVNETKLCNMQIGLHTNSENTNWVIKDSYQKHINLAIEGDNLSDCLYRAIDVITANRSLHDGKFKFIMNCPLADEEYTDLAARLSGTEIV